ncbi:MAG: PKD domain-containing protein [Archangium sp.]
MTQRGELAAEAGVPAVFTAQHTGCTWTFGDGATSPSARTVSHAFARSGRFAVEATCGGDRETWFVVVGPRFPAHLVPPDAQWVVLATEPDAIAHSVDSAERVIGPEAVRRWLDDHPLHAWAVEQEGGVGIDPTEGAAVFGWFDSQASIGVIGVDDEAKAKSSFREWLAVHDWSFVSDVQGLTRFEREDRALDVFADRGALYAVESLLTERETSAQSRIAAAPALGLDFDPSLGAALDALPSGSVITLRRLDKSLLAAVVRFGKDRVTWEGRLIRARPAWTAIDAGTAPSFLAAAPNGPIAVASTSAALGDVASLFVEPAELPELIPGLAALNGRAELAFYFDVEGFVRATLAGNGLPEPRGLLLIEAGVDDPARVRPLVEALSRRWELPLQYQDGTWSAQVRGIPLTIRLSSSRFNVRGGADSTERTSTDLRAAFPADALGPGHVAVRLDLARLREELLLPRRLQGIDPRRALVAQAAAVTVLDRITRADTATLLMHPTADGASFELTVTLRP